MGARLVLIARCPTFVWVASVGATPEEGGLVLYMPFEEGSSDMVYDRSGRDNRGGTEVSS